LQASRPGPPASDPARSPARLVAGAVALLAVLAGLGWGLFALTHRAPEDRGSRASGTLDLSSAVGRAVDTAVSDDPLRELARLLAAETRAGAAVERLTAGEDDATTQFGAEVFVLDPQTCQRPRLTIRPVGEKAPGIDGHVRVSLDTGAESPPELPLVGETLATGLAEWSVPVPARMLSEGWNRYRIELPVRPGKLSLSVTLEFSRPNGFPGPAPDWQKQRQEGDCPPASKLESAWVVYRDSRLLGAVKVMRELVRQHPFCTDAWFQYLKILLGTLHIREQFGKEAAVSIVSSFWEDELVRTPVPSLRREVRECFNRANRVRPGWAELWNMVGDWSRSLGAHDVALRMGRWTVLAAPRNAEAWFNLARAEDRMLPEVKFGALPQRDRPRAKVVLGHVEKALALAPAGSPLLPRVQALRAKLLVDVGLDHQARAAYAQLETTDRAEARRGLQRLGASTTFSGETSAPAEEPDVSPAPEASPDSDGAEGPTTSVEPAGPGPSSRVVPELTPLKRALADERRLEAAVVAAASPGSGAFQASVFLLDAGSVARAGLEVVAPDRGGASLRLALETRPGGDRGGPAQLPDQPETSPGRWNVPVPPRMLTQGFNRFTLTFAGQAGAALPRAALELERGEGFPEQALPREAPPLGGRCPPEPEQLERVWLMFRNEHGYAGLKYLRQLLTTYPACAEAHLTEARLLFQLALVREQLTQSGFGVLIGDFWEPEMLSATGWTLRHEAQDCFNRLDELFPGWALAWTAYAAWARELGDWDVAVRMARWAVLLRTEDVEAWLGLAAAEAGAVIAAGNAGSAGARAAAGLAMDHLGQALVLAGRDEATLARLELVRGTILKARGDVEQARAVFLRLATKLPDDAKRELTKLDAATKGAPTGP
jgi:tetratricopeptide (TPR) repeat protein